MKWNRRDLSRPAASNALAISSRIPQRAINRGISRRPLCSRGRPRNQPLVNRVQACASSDAIDVPNWAMDIGQWLPEWLVYGLLAWLVYGSVMTLANPHCMMRRCCQRNTIESLVDSEAIALVPQTCQRA